MPVIMAGILVLALCTSLLKASEAGPGSLHAPIIASLIGGLVFGAFAQKSRMCFAGSMRDIILMKNFDLFSVIAGLFVVMLVFNVATGRFVLGFNTPGIIAHSEHLWNILGMYAVGCHNFGLAASGTAMNAETQEVVAGAVPLNGRVACIICIVVCFIIAFTHKREQAK